MSEALYEVGGLRFWNANEIELREMFQSRIISAVYYVLSHMNPAWTFHRIEGPVLTPSGMINPAYGDDDVFFTNHTAGSQRWCLRPETTASSYAYARKYMTKPPFCVYQAGKSFRRELNDGASAAKLRFNEFWQLEFQCIYGEGTKADYRRSLMEVTMLEISRLTKAPVRIVESDRLPVYSESTCDIEAQHDGTWREMASCSIRTDYHPTMRVCEIAIGLDRVATLAAAAEIERP